MEVTIICVEYRAQYNPDICFKLFGEDKIQILSNINEGEEIEVFFNLSSREWNGKWFTSADALED